MTESSEILVIDVLSHGGMHHAFNEGYLRVLHAAVPGFDLRFLACAEHVRRLGPAIADIPRLSTSAIPPFRVPLGLSAHNPLAGTIAARGIRRSIIAATRPTTRLVAVLGVDANLFRVLPRGRRGQPPLHMILHGQLGEAMVWRSRNPWIRRADFIASIARGLPTGSKLVAIELGVAEAVSALAPNMAGSMVTLEHPVLTKEWADPASPPSDTPLRIAFLGHARKSKGFDLFLRLARRSNTPEQQFFAIGLAGPEMSADDLSCLVQAPALTAMPRAEYLRQLRSIDLVCVPHHSRAYNFTASGTISDAIAALRPLVALRTEVLEAIFERYGPIGLLADNESELAGLIATLDRQSITPHLETWTNNLRQVREARRPEALGPTYAASIEPPERANQDT